MCSVPMIIDNDKRCAPSSVRFGNRYYYGGGVNVNHGSMCIRSNIKKFRARMLLHRKIRKAIEKKCEKRSFILSTNDDGQQQSVVDSPIMMKRRKAFRQEDRIVSSIVEEIKYNRLNGSKCFQARMLLLQKVRFYQRCTDFPEELVQQCTILSDARKQQQIASLLFQQKESVIRMSCAAATLSAAASVSSHNKSCYVPPSPTVIYPKYNDQGYAYVSTSVIHPAFIYNHL